MPLSLTFQNGQVAMTNPVSSDASGSTIDTLASTRLTLALGGGTLANQADRAYHEARTLTGAATTYTLSALPGSQGMVKVRFILVSVDPTSTGTLAVAPGATHGWAGLTVAGLSAGAFAVVAAPALAGIPVASGTTDQVTFTATGAVTYTVLFAGTSA